MQKNIKKIKNILKIKHIKKHIKNMQKNIKKRLSGFAPRPQQQ